MSDSFQHLSLPHILLLRSHANVRPQKVSDCFSHIQVLKGFCAFVLVCVVDTANYIAIYVSSTPSETDFWMLHVKACFISLSYRD